MKKTIKDLMLKIFAYLYLIAGYIYIIYYYSYEVRIQDKPLGWFFLNVGILDLLAVYVLINHLLVKKVISNRTLFIIEAFLFITYVTIWWSDIMFYQIRPV